MQRESGEGLQHQETITTSELTTGPQGPFLETCE
jgi:hypothetical protein